MPPVRPQLLIWPAMPPQRACWLRCARLVQPGSRSWPTLRPPAVQLPDQSRNPPAESYKWRYLSCREAAFSPCGRWLAVVLEGRQRCTVPQPHPPLSRHITLYEVAICSTSEGYQQQASFCTGSAEPVIHWSTVHSHHLGIAQLQHRCAQPYPPTVQAAAFVVDALTGAVLPFMCPDTSETAQHAADMHKCDIAWAPDHSCLLVYGQRASGSTLGLVRGYLLMAVALGDHWWGRTLFFRPEGADMKLWPTPLWHPSSPSIVLDWGARYQDGLMDPDSDSDSEFEGGSGIIVGMLPRPFCIDPAGFSADGRHLVAFRRPAHAGPGACCMQYVLSCTISDVALCFAVVHALPDHPPGMDLAWLPSQPALLMHMPSGLPDQVLHVDSKQVQLLADRVQPCSQHVSPSGRWFMAQQARSLRIIDLQTGQVQWTSSTAGPDRRPLKGLGHRKQRNEGWDNDVPRSLVCQAWLPSGQGLMCITPGVGVAKAPCLRVVTFA